MDNVLKQLATNVYQRTDSNGVVHIWYQEDENAVTSKAEAVDMVQRTIDFWLPQLAEDVAREFGLTPEQAQPKAQDSFKHTLSNMLCQPFAVRWGLTVEDFTWPES